MLSLSSAPKCGQGLAGQLIGCDDEYARWFGIGDVDHAEVAARARLTECHAGAFATGAIFERVLQDFLYLIFINGVIVDVRHARDRVHVEADYQGSSPLF